MLLGLAGSAAPSRRALPELPAQGQRARPSPGWPGGPCRVAAAAGAAGAWMALPGDREERDPCLGLMLLEEDAERGGSVQALCAPRAVTRSHPKPAARSYESLFSFSCPAWSLLYSSVFRAAESAVKEPRIPLDNLGRAGPGCSPSIKPSFSRLSFPVPWHPNWKGCGQDAVPLAWGGICPRNSERSRAAPFPACSISFSFWRREQISFCTRLD